MADAASEPSGGPGAPSGHFQAFPMFLRANTQLQGLTFSLLPWGSPGLSAGVGVTGNVPPEPLLLLAYEWPVPWLRTTRLRKTDIEAIHLHRFGTDNRLGLGQLPFSEATVGSDPPDYRAVVDGEPVGIDCSALTVQERRGGDALFVNIRRRASQTDPGAFAHLGGFTLYLWFNEEDRTTLPFKPSDKGAIDELIQEMATYRPDPAQLRVPAGEMPERAPDLGLVTTSTGAAFYAAPHLNAVPDTAFWSAMGFELGFAYTTEHTPSQVWGEIQRLVDQHDKSGVDWLILSAGAPNQDGLTFPTEELVAQLAIQHPHPLKAPKFISRLTIHFWSSGEAFDLLPELGRRFGPLYAGAVPAHRPIQPPPLG